MTVTLSSAAIRRNALGANGAPFAGSAIAAARRVVPVQVKPMLSASAPTLPAPFRNARRLGSRA
jgi:hypothetical protein